MSREGANCVLTEDEAFEMISFLVSAAEICLHEPVYYGTFRLVDAASRMIGFMLEKQGLESEEFLRAFKTDLDTRKTWMMWDREAYFDFLRSIPADVATEVERRAAAGEGAR